MMKTSIVIPVHNSYEQTNQILSDIRFKCRSVSEVIVIDDASNDDRATQGGMRFWSKQLPLRVITLEENIGFLLAANIGTRQAAGDLIVVMNNDVRIDGSGWYANMLSLADDNVLLGGTLYKDTTGWNKFGDIIIPYLEGWCLGTSRDTWKKLGYFDERYAPSDFEDVDLSMTAMNEGVSLFEVKGCQHLGAKSYGYTAARRERTVANRKKFAEKWGLVCEEV